MPNILTDHDCGDEAQAVRDLDVVTWRFDCLCAAGYPSDVAVMLAGRGYVDLHLACELLAHGASVHQALRIVS